MILCVIGAFGLNNSMDDLYIMFAFGIIGYVMRKYKIPIAPAVLGLVLGDLAELALRRSLLLSLGDPMILISRPISLDPAFGGGRVRPLAAVQETEDASGL